MLELDWRVELLLHSGQLKPASVEFMYTERKERCQGSTFTSCFITCPTFGSREPSESPDCATKETLDSFSHLLCPFWSHLLSFSSLPAGAGAANPTSDLGIPQSFHLFRECSKYACWGNFRGEETELTTPRTPPPTHTHTNTFQCVRITSLSSLQHSRAIAASDLRWAPGGGIADGGRAAAGCSSRLYTGVTVFGRTFSGCTRALQG